MRYKVYTTDGSELEASSVALVNNKAGKGYRVVAEIGGREIIIFYKLNEIVKISQEK